VLPVHLGSLFAVTVGGALIYFIGLKLGAVLTTKWIRWPILIFVGLNAIPGTAFVAFGSMSAALSYWDVPGIRDDRAWLSIAWFLLALPIYLVLFVVGARRAYGKRPNPTRERDARESGARPSS
jgi:hypothetical protein